MNLPQEIARIRDSFGALDHGCRPSAQELSDVSKGLIRIGSPDRLAPSVTTVELSPASYKRNILWKKKILCF